MRKVLPILTLALFAVAIVLPLSSPQSVEGQSATEALTTDRDAKTDDLFNGFGVKGVPIDECVNEPEPPTARGNGRFEDNKFIFSERETIEDGLGPTYNDVGCVECHQSIDVGAFGQQMEFRAGHLVNGQFVDAPGGQLSLAGRLVRVGQSKRTRAAPNEDIELPIAKWRLSIGKTFRCSAHSAILTFGNWQLAIGNLYNGAAEDQRTS